MAEKRNIFLVGPMGAGKSTILAYLSEKYQARVIELDKAAHLCMQPGTDCFDRIVKNFGREILAADGSICRPALSKIVFTDRSKVEELNRIVHPAVKNYIREEIQRRQKKTVCRLLYWRRHFFWKTITMRSVMRSGTFMWRMRCGLPVCLLPEGILLKRPERS